MGGVVWSVAPATRQFNRARRHENPSASIEDTIPSLPPLPPGFGKPLLKHYSFKPGYRNLNHGSWGAVPVAVQEATAAKRALMEADPESVFRYPFDADPSGTMDARSSKPPWSSNTYAATKSSCDLHGAGDSSVPMHDSHVEPLDPNHISVWMREGLEAFASVVGLEDPADRKNAVLVPNATYAANCVIQSVVQSRDHAVLYFDVIYGSLLEIFQSVVPDVAGRHFVVPIRKVLLEDVRARRGLCGTGTAARTRTTPGICFHRQEDTNFSSSCSGITTAHHDEIISTDATNYEQQPPAQADRMSKRPGGEKDFTEQVQIVPLRSRILAAVRETLQMAEKQKKKIRLASFDHISCIPAIRFPVEEVVQLCKTEFRHVVDYVQIDGAHAPGQIPDLDVRKINADFYFGNAHKWLSGARSCALLYVKNPIIYFPPEADAIQADGEHHLNVHRDHPPRQELHLQSKGKDGVLLTGKNPSEILGEEVPSRSDRKPRLLVRDVLVADSIPSPAFDSALQKEFSWRGTSDPAAYYGVKAGVDYRRNVLQKTEREICAYQHALALRGSAILKRAWKSETMPANLVGEGRGLLQVPGASTQNKTGKGEIFGTYSSQPKPSSSCLQHDLFDAVPAAREDEVHWDVETTEREFVLVSEHQVEKMNITRESCKDVANSQRTDSCGEDGVVVGRGEVDVVVGRGASTTAPCAGLHQVLSTSEDENDSDLLGCLFNVRLPYSRKLFFPHRKIMNANAESKNKRPGTTSAEVEVVSSCAQDEDFIDPAAYHLGTRLRTEYSTWVPYTKLQGLDGQMEFWARISAAMYTDEADFHYLANAVLEILELK
ncbi:unnamed protein product [Amoebophrya sp. A120]|nr:unnamed protein product [Amoebophrya sp. A120]|eukprot:GSA120T00005929001.1